MTIFILTQVRMNSKRLPGKAMMNLNGKPAIEYQLDVLKQLNCQFFDFHFMLAGVVVTNDKDDDPIKELTRSKNIRVFDDSDPGNTYAGFMSALKAMGASNNDIVVRLTGDCPLLTKLDITEALRIYYNKFVEGKRYYYNGYQGHDVEVFDYTLFCGYSKSELKTNRWDEHCPTFIRDTMPELCHYGKITEDKLSIDTQEEFNKVKEVINKWNL